MIKEVAVEKIVEVEKEVIKEVIKEVPVERIVEKVVEVEKEVIKEVPVEKIVEVEKEVITEVIREVPAETAAYDQPPPEIATSAAVEEVTAFQAQLEESLEETEGGDDLIQETSWELEHI